MIEAIEQIQATVAIVLPEIALLATVCALFFLGPMIVTEAGEAPAGLRHQWGMLSLIGIAVACGLWLLGAGPETTESSLFGVDELLSYTRGATFALGAVLVLLLWNQIDDGHSAEAHACLLAIFAGTNLVAASNDLVSLFLSLELVSIPTYVILFLPVRNQPAREATLKYFLLSIFSSALVLYGMSWLYGAGGTTNLPLLAEAATGDASPAASTMMRFALALLVGGLAFRITAVPFHFYAPDVFQGSTASNAAMLSFIPKVVGFVALLKVIPLTGALDAASDWLSDAPTTSLLATIAVVTMFLGNLMALRQSNIYRLMAYSSVAHAGYMLVGLTVGDVSPVSGITALLFYLVVYGLMTIGVFACLAAVDSPNHPMRSDADLRGLARRYPGISLMLAVCLLSLTGLPPAAGFFGKLNLFLAAWSGETTLARTLAALIALNAAIGAYYYLRLVALVYLDAPEHREAAPAASRWPAWIAAAVCTAGTILLFVDPGWLWSRLP